MDERVEVIERAPVSTWFGVGGGADALCRPGTAGGVVACVRGAIERGERVRVLGDGANLLVADSGVDGLVVDLERLVGVEVDAASGRVRAGAGARLPQLITRTAREGLAGLEVLGGIPASVGGAVAMNAGGRFGEICERVESVECVDPRGELVTLARGEIDFGYRRSGLAGLVIVAATFALTPEDPGAVRDRLKDCMAYKKRTQPLGDDSAGCCFKNPTLREDLAGIGAAGERVSAGMLLDRAGCKGMAVGAARVSEAHANFLVTGPGATASDVIGLMDAAAGRVLDRFGVRLEREVVVWERGS